MKLPPQHFSIVLAALSCVSSPLFAVTEAMTDPVGFITIPVLGTNTATPKISLISPTLTQPVVWQGTVTDVSSTANSTTITVAATVAPVGPWSNGQFNPSGSYYVEVSSSTKAGALSDITTTTTNTIVTAENISSLAAIGDSIRIRKHITLNDFLGANNTFGLYASDDPGAADEVLIYNGATYVPYFYYTGDVSNPAGWYTAGGSSAGSTVIGPNDGVVIKRKIAGDKSIVFSGAVKTGDTKFPIVSGVNVVGTVSAKGLTLDNSGLYKSDDTALHATDDPGSADEVLLYTAGAVASYFRYIGDASNPAGWYTAGGTPAGATSIPPGISFVIKRKTGGPFNWVLPAPATF